MSNVIIGILSIVIMVGLALVGTSYFGDETTRASRDAQATTYLSRLATIASATKIYNRDAFPPAPATTSLAFLSDVGVDTRTLPNGQSVRLLGAGGSVSGTARFVAVSLGSSEIDGGRMCSSLLGLMSVSGSRTPASSSTWPTGDSRGCFRASAAIGPYASGEYIAYVGI